MLLSHTLSPLCRSLPATATVSGILDEMAGWGVNADAVDFAHGVMLDGARVLVLNFTGCGPLHLGSRRHSNKLCRGTLHAAAALAPPEDAGAAG